MNVILGILDQCAKDFSFPMLNNGYVYLAATRLALFRSPVSGPLSHWALVIEVFGFSPRAGHPDTSICTFADKLHDRDSASDYVSVEGHQAYLAKNPHNEYRTIFPVDFESSQDGEDYEFIAGDAQFVMVRNQKVAIPSATDFALAGIELGRPSTIQVFELCRYLAATLRDRVLATRDEQRVSILPEMERILQLDEWSHPDLASGQLPSESITFQQLADVLVSGDTSLYRPNAKPNTHWENWPEGGTL